MLEYKAHCFRKRHNIKRVANIYRVLTLRQALGAVFVYVFQLQARKLTQEINSLLLAMFLGNSKIWSQDPSTNPFYQGAKLPLKHIIIRKI